MGTGQFLLDTLADINHPRVSIAGPIQIRYADLDDDWDAGLDEVVVKPNPPPMLDSLYPDLTVQLPLQVPEKSQHKESMDDIDLEAKAEISKLNQLNSKYAKFRKILASDTIINLQDLRKLAWNGIPNELRALSWLLLLGYLLQISLAKAPL